MRDGSFENWHNIGGMEKMFEKRDKEGTDWFESGRLMALY